MPDKRKNNDQIIDELLHPRSAKMRSALSSEKQMIPKPDIPDVTLTQWQGNADIMALVCSVPAVLIMKVHPSEIEVLVSAKVPGNPYHPGEKAPLNTGLYCETVMSTRERLLVPNALKNSKWDHNPDISLGMICYLGYPLQWPDGEIFGTICILDNKENIFSEQMDNFVRLFRGNIENYLALLFESKQREKAEDDLRSNLSRFKTGISSLYGALLLVTRDGVEEFANQAFCGNQRCVYQDVRLHQGRYLRQNFKPDTYLEKP